MLYLVWALIVALHLLAEGHGTLRFICLDLSVLPCDQGPVAGPASQVVLPELREIRR